MVHGPQNGGRATSPRGSWGSPVASADVLSIPRGPGLARRVGRCCVGLVVFGLGVSLMVRADLGLAPWDVLHQGLSDLTGIPMGTISILVGLALLLLWIPLGQRVGIGTLLNAVLVGVTIDVALAVLPSPATLAVRWLLLAAGLLVVALGSGLYIGAGLGTGPRDGLMMGLKAKGVSVGVARTGIELAALAIGWALGGSVGVGTVVAALALGPLVHWTLPRFSGSAPRQWREARISPERAA